MYGTHTSKSPCLSLGSQSPEEEMEHHNAINTKGCDTGPWGGPLVRLRTHKQALKEEQELEGGEGKERKVGDSTGGDTQKDGKEHIIGRITNSLLLLDTEI